MWANAALIASASERVNEACSAFAAATADELCDRMCGVQSDLVEAIDFHHAIIAEGNKALIGYATAKASPRWAVPS